MSTDTGLRGSSTPPPEQPDPVANDNDSVPIWELVMADMHARDQVGRERYGTRLQAFNGRSSLLDLYEELLDAVVYCRTHLEERRRRDALIVAAAMRIVLSQPNFPDTVTGHRQQWVRDEIARRLGDLIANPELLEHMITEAAYEPEPCESGQPA